MSTITVQKKGLGMLKVSKGYPFCITKKPQKKQDFFLSIELFRYKEGAIQILQSWEEKQKIFLYSLPQLQELAQHKRFLMRVNINRFKFIIPIGYDNPRFYEGGKFLKILFEQKESLSLEQTCSQENCLLALTQAERITKNRIRNGENLIFTSESVINYLPEDFGRPVNFDTSAIRFFGRDSEKGLYLIENGVGIRSL